MPTAGRSSSLRRPAPASTTARRSHSRTPSAPRRTRSRSSTRWTTPQRWTSCCRKGQRREDGGSRVSARLPRPTRSAESEYGSLAQEGKMEPGGPLAARLVLLDQGHLARAGDNRELQLDVDRRVADRHVRDHL